MTKERNLRRMEKCPRFPRCSTPLCPLDEDKDKRVYLKGEPKCTLPKSLRTRFGTDLLWKGLFPKELAASKRWHEKSPKERKKFIAGGAEYRFAPASQK